MIRPRKGLSIKVGSAEFSNHNRSVAETWKLMPTDERELWAKKAMGLSKARRRLRQCPLNQEPSDDCKHSLSEAQRHRLNQERLDATLAQVATHPAWDAGLRLSDHISALRASLVCCLPEETVNQQWQSHFAYDSNIQPNSDSSFTFHKSCLCQHGAICRQEPHFAHAAQLVDQFDSVLQAEKLESSPVLIHFVYQVRRWIPALGDRTCPSPSEWMLLGCVGKRPKAQIVMKVYPTSETSVAFVVNNGLPTILTSHQMFARMLKMHQANKQPLCHFGLEAGCFESSADKFWFITASLNLYLCRLSLSLCACVLG